MIKTGLLLLVSLVSTGAFAGTTEATTPLVTTDKVFEIAIAETGISKNLASNNTNQTEIYEYADRVFEEISTDIEEAFLASLDRQFAIHLSAR